MSFEMENLNDAELIYQGAEARVFKISLFGSPAVLKERFKKSYRHPDLEARLCKARHTQEVRASARALKAGVLTPTVFLADAKSNKIVMEFVEGKCLRDVIDHADNAKKESISKALGGLLGRLHNADIIHGDLTTSNVLQRDVDNKLVLIDFGLAKSNANVEDKAVDMYVLERAFLSTHPGSEQIFSKVMESYFSALSEKNREKVRAKFKQVQQRGRKREMIG
mmetsp:Transcript_21277/g.37667  ORF Transcript_21277/g.37667 Transcript_21277/m.37667 type:complete len:223 (-) Transcript_21277:2339-3007(-)